MAGRPAKISAKNVRGITDKAGEQAGDNGSVGDSEGGTPWRIQKGRPRNCEPS